MMNIDKATKEQIHSVALNMRQIDFEEISAMTWHEGREELAQALAAGHTDDANCYCAVNDGGEAVSIFGWNPIRPGVWYVFMFATDDWLQVSKEVTEWLSDKAPAAFDSAKAHRVECQSLSSHKGSHKWLEYFGFKQESVLKQFGANGEDFVSFVWNRPEGKRETKWVGPGKWE